MNNVVPATYSTIDKLFLLNKVQEDYEIGSIKKIRFHRRSLNDTYLLLTEKNKYLLRVYRKWRTAEDVGFECDWLKYLNVHHSPAMQIVPKKDGSLFSTIEAPEGARCLVLFPWLEDVHHQPLTQEAAGIAGEALAKIHDDSTNFKSNFKRFELKINHLIDEPMQGIISWYGEIQDLTQINHYAEQAKMRMKALKKEKPSFGVCHGDIHFGNIMFTKNNMPVWLDFDCCGMGWLVYDLASFYWALKIKWAGWQIEYQDSDEEIWKGFLAGYQKIRRLDKLERETLPYFVIARGIWALGLHPNNIDDWTTEGCGDGGIFFNMHLKLFEQVLKENI